MGQDKPVLFESVINVVLNAADPFETLGPYLPDDTSGRVHVVGAGKAAAKMAAALENVWEGDITGMVITRYGHGFPTRSIRVIEAAHPVPDQVGHQAAEEIFQQAQALGEDDHLIVLLSGGGSALMSLPIEGVSLAQKQKLNQDLLMSGASIHEMNCVRKHLSRIKGGGLAKAAYPARVTTFAISDVAGDDPSVIASGPSIEDPTTVDQAIAILKKYNLDFDGPLSETVKAGDPYMEKTAYHLIATPGQALYKAAHYVVEQGLNCDVLSDVLEGDVADMACTHMAEVAHILNGEGPLNPPCVLLSGGEATVTLENDLGRGGPNAEFILHLLHMTKGRAGLYAMAIDTDGIDGSVDHAGAWIGPNTYQKALDLGLSIEEALENHTSYDFFKALDQLIMTGPTLTNINDFRLILIEL